jgi:hypothetical protein
MTDADELERMAIALRAEQSIEPWRPLIKRLFPKAKCYDHYAIVKRDRLILQEMTWDVNKSASLLSPLHRLSVQTTTKICESSVSPYVRKEGHRLYDAMSSDERAARFNELLQSTAPQTNCATNRAMGDMPLT